MKTKLHALVFSALLGLGAFMPAYADQNLAGNVTVTGGNSAGNLIVTGGVDVDGNSVTFGTQDASFGAGLFYADSTADTLNFFLNRASASWLWQHTTVAAMRLDSGHKLSLYAADGTTLGASLDPVSSTLSLGSATLAANGTALTANGAFTVTGAFTAPSYTATSGVLNGGTSGLTLFAGGTNQNITLAPTGDTGQVVITDTGGAGVANRLLTIRTNNGGLGRDMVSVVNDASGTSAYAAITTSVDGANGSFQTFGTNYGTASLQNVTGVFGGQHAGIGAMATGGTIRFYTNSTGNEVGRFASSGNLLLGSTTDSANGRLQLASHTTSPGGIGFGTDTSLFREADGKIKLYSATSLNPQLTIETGAADSNAFIRLIGRLGGVSKPAYIFADWNGGLVMGAAGAAPYVQVKQTSGNVMVGSTTTSTSTTTGALVVNGGVGVGGALRVGGGFNISGGLSTISFASNAANPSALSITPTFTNTSASFASGLNSSPTGTMSSSGAYIVGMQTGASLTAGSTAAGTVGIYLNPINTSNSSVTTNYGVLINHVTGATTNYAVKTGLGLVNLGDTTPSSSASTGALTVAGGVGIAGSLNVGGTFTASSYTASGGAITGGSTGLTFNAGGSNQNVTVTPSGSGATVLNGNVGIGTTTPGSKLDVSGNASISGLVGIGGTPGTNGAKLFISGEGNYGSGRSVSLAVIPFINSASATSAYTVADVWFSLTGSATVPKVTAYQSNGGATGAASLGDFIAFSSTQWPSGTVSNNYGFRAAGPSGTGNYGVYVDAAKSFFGGNVGVGTTTPNYKFSAVGGNVVAQIAGTGAWPRGNEPLLLGQLGSAGAVQFARSSDGSAQAYVGYSSGSESSELVIGSDGGGGYTKFNTGGSEKMRITTSGNVGIGTASPTQGLLQLQKASTYTSETTAALAILSGSADTELLLGADATNDVAYIQSVQQGTSYTTRPLAINPNGGNVGIGTTTPAAKLDVAGELRVTGTGNTVLKGVVLVTKQGDLDMGEFTAGANPNSL